MTISPCYSSKDGRAGWSGPCYGHLSTIVSTPTLLDCPGLVQTPGPGEAPWKRWKLHLNLLIKMEFGGGEEHYSCDDEDYDNYDND